MQKEKESEFAKEFQKFGIAELLNGLTLESIKKKYRWVLKAKFREAILGEINNRLIWYDGYWDGGEWNDGIWVEGVWYSGAWKNGKWYSGTWTTGQWRGGSWYGGEWHSGVYFNGIEWTDKEMPIVKEK